MVLRAGLIGMGKMGRNHARVISSTEGINFVGIADPMGDPSGLIDNDLVYDSVDKLIEDWEAAILPEDVVAGSVDLYRYLYDNYNSLTCCNMNISYATNDRISSWNLGKRVWDDGFTNLTQR